MNRQQFRRNTSNDSHLYHREIMGVTCGPRQHAMNNRSIPHVLYPTPNPFYRVRGGNQPMMNIHPTYDYVQDNHFIHHENSINHAPVRRHIIPTHRWFDTIPERNQSRQSIRNVLPTYAYDHDNQFIHYENITNQIPLRREIIPTQRWSNTYMERNQPRLRTRDVFLDDVYVQDDHYILHESNMNQTPIRRYILPTYRWSNTNFERNQPRLSTRNVYPFDAYVQDDHFISHTNNINQHPTRRYIVPVHRWSNTDFERNQPRLSSRNVYPTSAYVPVRRDIISIHIWFNTNLERSQFRRSIRNVLPTYVYDQDNHFILRENNTNQVPVRRETIPTHRRPNTNLERNQHRLSTRDVILEDSYDQDDQYILQENNINQAPVRRGIIPTQRRTNANLRRNRSRMNTQDVLIDDAYVQDDHFPERNINETSVRRDTEVTKRCDHTNLKIIQIEEGTKDSEAMTCSICLVELLGGSKAIQLPSPCLHVYHEDCILKWLDISSTCPLCRRYVG